MHCADKMQHWLACWCDCPAFASQSAFLVMCFLKMRALFLLQNLFGLGLASVA